MLDSGAFIISRKTFESEIWNKPSWWFKVWIYILGQVKYEDNHICKRGENFFTAEQIFIDCKLGHEGIKAKTIHNAIAWLTEVGMLTTQKTTRGMFIRVLKYEAYQNISNYKKDTEKDKSKTASRQEDDTITKEGIKNNEIEIPKGIKGQALEVYKGDAGINEIIETIKRIVNSEELGLMYKPGLRERQRAQNILTGKDFGEVCDKAKMTRLDFCKNIILLSSRLSFWNGKINNAETLYKHYAQVYNDGVNKKAELEAKKPVRLSI